MPVNKLLLKEEKDYLLQLFKNKELNLYLTSGTNYCYDIEQERNFSNNLTKIKEVLDLEKLTFNHIYLDSNYISSKDASLFKYPIIKIWNDKYYNEYKNFTCYNYIDDLKYYIEGIENYYLLNDNNIVPELLNYDLKIIETNITKLTEGLKILLLRKELLNFKTLPWEEYKKTISNNNCYANNTLTIDVHTLDIIPCTGINNTQYTLGHIYDDGIWCTHTGIATQVLGCDKCKGSSFCSQCKASKICGLSCYYKSFKQNGDPFLTNDVECEYNKEKAIYLAYIYNLIGIRKKAIEKKDSKLVKFIDNNLNKGEINE